MAISKGPLQVSITDGMRARSMSVIEEFLQQHMDMSMLGDPVAGRCSSCNTHRDDIVVHYNVFGMNRQVCKFCCGKVVDKMFGVGPIDEDTEKLLYDK